jgi:hypothetical protein
MSAFYLEIDVQEPFDMGKLDAQGRVQYVMNILAVKAYSTSFPYEIIKRLEDASVGVRNVTLFFSSAVDITPDPDDPTAFCILRETGGPSPDRSQNSITVPNHQRPTAHLLFKALSTPNCRAMAWAAYAALVNVRNTTLTG